MNDPNAPGGQQPPAPQSPTPPPPPPAGWQSTPQPPGPPPMGGGQPGSGMPSWTSNLTAQGTISGPGGVALADAPQRIIALFIDFIILGIIGYIVNTIMTGILGDNYLGLFWAFVPNAVADQQPRNRSHPARGDGCLLHLMWTRMAGATVGMRVLKLQVRDAATGGPITQNQAITRWVFLGAPFAVEYFYGWTLGIIISLAVLDLLHLPDHHDRAEPDSARDCTTSRPRRSSRRSPDASQSLKRVRSPAGATGGVLLLPRKGRLSTGYPQRRWICGWVRAEDLKCVDKNVDRPLSRP